MAIQLNDYRLLGRSGLRVSPLSLGAMTFGLSDSWGNSDEDATRMFKLYTERGGNFVDTANFYAQGRSETLVGNLMEGVREQIVLATKYSLTMRARDPNGAGNHRKNMVQAVEASLRRLKTGYIDLFYLHIWDRRTPVEEILRGFDDLVRAGKIVYAGISDSPAWQISRMNAIAELRGWAPLIALQIPYNLTERTVERELMPMALEMGLGVVPWSPLAGGILAGNYSKSDLAPTIPASKSGPGHLNNRKGVNLAMGRLNERTLAIAEQVKAIAQEVDRSPSQIALAWTLLHPSVISPIIGARTFAQFEDNLAALDVTLTSDQIARLDAVSRIDMGFPHEMIHSDVTAGLFGGMNMELPKWR